MVPNQFTADIINAERARADAKLIEHLEKLGILTSIRQMTGDNSYPTEYTLTYERRAFYGELSVVGPTLDLALLEFLEKLLYVADPPIKKIENCTRPDCCGTDECEGS